MPDYNTQVSTLERFKEHRNFSYLADWFTNFTVKVLGDLKANESLINNLCRFLKLNTVIYDQIYSSYWVAHMKVKTSFASSIHFSILHTALVFMALQILVSNILARSLNIPFPLIFFCTSSILQSNTNRVSIGSTADFSTKATLDRGTDINLTAAKDFILHPF